MTKFLLAEHYIGGKIIEIPIDRFELLLSAKKVVRLIWDVEETFAILAKSFVELEEYLLSAGINYYFQIDIKRNADHFFDDVRQTINLK